MKKIFLLVLFLFLAPVVFAEQHVTNYSTAGAYKFPDIQVVQLMYEPYPVNPGEYFDLWIKAENMAKAPTEDATFKLFIEYPFSLAPGMPTVQSFGKITYENPVVVKYRVKADENAVDGTNELKLGYNIDGDSDSWNFRIFDIEVADAQTDFDLVLQEIQDQTVSIAIANTGKNIAYSVIAKIPEQQNFDTIGTSGQMVGNLENGDYTMVSFDLKQKTRGAGKKPLDVQIDYTDTIGERRHIIKQVNYEIGGTQAGVVQAGSSDGSSASPQPQLNGRQGFRQPVVQTNKIYQEWWFWAIILGAAFVLWTGFKKIRAFRSRNRKK